MVWHILCHYTGNGQIRPPSFGPTQKEKWSYWPTEFYLADEGRASSRKIWMKSKGLEGDRLKRDASLLFIACLIRSKRGALFIMHNLWPAVALNHEKWNFNLISITAVALAHIACVGLWISLSCTVTRIEGLEKHGYSGTLRFLALYEELELGLVFSFKFLLIEVLQELFCSHPL